MVDIEEVAQDVVNATIKVHRGLGLLESVYQLFIGNFAPSFLCGKLKLRNGNKPLLPNAPFTTRIVT